MRRDLGLFKDMESEEIPDDIPAGKKHFKNVSISLMAALFLACIITIGLVMLSNWIMS